jgi:hypothetical protein
MTAEEIYLRTSKFLNEEATKLVKKLKKSKNEEEKKETAKKLVSLKMRIEKEIEMFNKFLGKNEENS